MVAGAPHGIRKLGQLDSPAVLLGAEAVAVAPSAKPNLESPAQLPVHSMTDKPAKGSMIKRAAHTQTAIKARVNKAPQVWSGALLCQAPCACVQLHLCLSQLECLAVMRLLFSATCVSLTYVTMHVAHLSEGKASGQGTIS